MFAYLATAIVLTSLVLLIIKRWWDRKTDPLRWLPPLPGPRSWPGIGNVLDIPTDRPWEVYAQWKETYGDIVQMHIFNQPVIILNSQEVAYELLQKRSHSWSNRPQILMTKLMGWDFSFVFLPYGNEWRDHRRVFNQEMKSEAAMKYRPAQMVKAHDLLRRLITTPSLFSDHVKIFAASSIMYTMYGYQVNPESDSFVKTAEEAVEMLINSMSPGAQIANNLTFLRYLPTWVPGAGFKRFANKCKRITKNMQDKPFDLVKENMTSGIAIQCVTSELLERNQCNGGSLGEETIIKRVSAVAYSAGVDTITSAVWTAILAMVLYPKAQKRAQEEIDRVVGSSRLPDFGDRESLVYVEAFFREVLRWHPPVPLGVAHSTSCPDVFRGCYVPKDAYVMANIWAIAHDEDFYPDPHAFRPERFLTPDGRLNDDHQSYVFGFGRRTCPGRHVGEANVWAALVSMLATLSFSKTKDTSGNEIEIQVDFTESTVSRPLPFMCAITPRSGDALRLIQETSSPCTILKKSLRC